MIGNKQDARHYEQAIHHPDPAKRRVQGQAHAQAVIEVKSGAVAEGAGGAAPAPVSLPVTRGAPGGESFSATADAAVTDGGVWRRIEIKATRPGVGAGGGPMNTRREGWQFASVSHSPAARRLTGGLELHLHDGALGQGVTLRGLFGGPGLGGEAVDGLVRLGGQALEDVGEVCGGVDALAKRCQSF